MPWTLTSPRPSSKRKRTTSCPSKAAKGTFIRKHRIIVLNLLKIDLSDTRSLPKKRRRAMLDHTYRDSLLSIA